MGAFTCNLAIMYDVVILSWYSSSGAGNAGNGNSLLVIVVMIATIDCTGYTIMAKWGLMIL